MKIEVLRPLHIRRATGDLHLKPGCPVELPDDDAVRLLAKKPDVVRRVLTPHGGNDVPMPGARIAWTRQDGTKVSGVVDQVLVEPDAVWVFVMHDDGAWSVLNPRKVRLQLLNSPIDATGGGRGRASHAA